MTCKQANALMDKADWFIGLVIVGAILAITPLYSAYASTPVRIVEKQIVREVVMPKLNAKLLNASGKTYAVNKYRSLPPVPPRAMVIAKGGM